MIYKQAFDKITEAYFKDEIRPMDNSFCFCGTLGKGWWNGDENYSPEEYKKMEWALLRRLIGIYTELLFITKEQSPCASMRGFGWGWCNGENEPKTKEYEDALFRGLCDSLEVLMEIHISRGENVENIVINKRELILQ